jgi:glycosyltransferase involved in cell wall biosynthesis
MDLFVLPSHREGLSRTLMEAAAMGLPAVTTDVRGCRDVVVNGRSGQVVPLGNVEALAEALIDLLLNPEKRQQMGQVARLLAIAQFDEQVVFAHIDMEYQQLLLERGLADLARTLQPSSLLHRNQTLCTNTLENASLI